MTKRISLTQYLVEQQREHGHIPSQLRLLIEVVARACKRISISVNKGALGEVLVAYLYPGVQVQNFTSALIAAFVIGLFNMVLRPVLVLLTLPVTVITLGLFLFVINALLFWAAASVLDGFHVNGFGAALLGSLIYSAIMLVVDAALKSILSR